MLEFLLGALASVWVMIGLAVLCVLSEYKGGRKEEYFWANFWAIALMTSVVYNVGVNPVYAYIIMGFWLPVGAFWSLLKWRWRSNAASNEFKNSNFTGIKREGLKNLVLRKLDINENKTLISHWVIFWPLSMFQTITIDLFETIEFIITVKLGNIYKKLSQSAIDDINNAE